MFFVACQFKAMLSGRCFFKPIIKVRFFTSNWTEWVCAALKWGHRVTGSGRHQTYWSTGQSTGLSVFLSLSPPLARPSSHPVWAHLSLHIWSTAWRDTLPLFLFPTMCRHIACGVICLVFVILFDDLLNVLIIFVLFFLVNHFTQWT